ncbi:MAG TPA: hypothetical protein P5160_03450, partial [Candidatus Omnitrophota bacterium]|nr:hypothetical protein [Candidatus Omnitrophota bacterium]
PGIKTRKIIGLSLEQAGVSERLLKPLERTIEDSAVISLSESRRGTINAKWKVIIHAPQG